MPLSLPIKALSAGNKLLLWLMQLVVLFVVLSYLWLFKSFTIVADINQIFTVVQSEDVRLVSEQVEQQQLRQHVMLVGHQDKNNAIKYAEQAAVILRSIDGIEVSINFPALPQLQSVVNDYLPYQHAFISNAYHTVLQTNDLDTVFNYQFSLLNEMGSPWVAATLETDPSLSLADYFNRQQLPTTALKNELGYFIAKQNNSVGAPIYYVLVNFVSAGTGLDLNIATEIARKVADLKQQNAEQATAVDYLVTGAAFLPPVQVTVRKPR